MVLGVRKSIPNNEFFENHTYTLDKSGKKDFKIDNKFTCLESKVAPIIVKVVESDLEIEAPSFNRAERNLLQEFVVSLRRRIPDIREDVNKAAESLVQEIPKKYEEYVGRPLNQDEQVVVSSQDFLKSEKNDFFARFAGTEPSTTIMSVLSDCSIVTGFTCSQNKSFIIGSSPVGKFNEWIPISKKVAIRFARPHEVNDLVESINHTATMKINGSTAERSKRFAGESHQLIKTLVDSR